MDNYCVEEEEFIVEDLLKLEKRAKHPRKDAHQYMVFVKWQGYDDDTWEPLENIIDDVPEMAETFLLKHMNVGVDDLRDGVIKYKDDIYFQMPKTSAGKTSPGKAIPGKKARTPQRQA